MNNKELFSKWLFEVCDHNANKLHKNITEIYSLVDLADVKLAFIDGELAEDYNIN